MPEARDILLTLRGFILPIVAYAIFAPIATFLVPSRRAPEQRMARLLLVGAICLTMTTVAFLLTEDEQIIFVMKFRPAWGFYAGLLAVCGVGTIGKFALDQSRQNRTVVNLTNPAAVESSANKIRVERYKIALSVGSVIAIIWLSRIAAGS
jgi:hypothetical protein